MQEGHLVEEAAPEKKSWEGKRPSPLGSQKHTRSIWARLSADYLEDPRPYWEESDRCCPHGQTEARGTPPGDPDSETVPHGAPEAEAPERDSGEGTATENDACGTEPETGDLEAPEEEEELSLTVTYTEEKTGSLRGLTEDVSSLRRRNRRRKAKKASHWLPADSRVFIWTSGNTQFNISLCI